MANQKNCGFKKIQEESTETKIKHLFVKDKKSAINVNWIFDVVAF